MFYSATPGGAGTQIATVPLANGGYVWTIGDTLPDGNYWVSAVANDGLNTFGQLAKALIRVSGTQP